MVEKNNSVFEVSAGLIGSRYYIIAKTFTEALNKLKKQKVDGIKDIHWLGKVLE